MLKVKRIYDPPAAEDGYRILVDGLWPRGVSKERARLDEWRRDLAPSPALRVWFRNHDPGRWDEYRRRYRTELEAAGKMEYLREIGQRARRENVTLLYATRDREHNNPIALREMILGQ